MTSMTTVMVGTMRSASDRVKRLVASRGLALDLASSTSGHKFFFANMPSLMAEGVPSLGSEELEG